MYIHVFGHWPISSVLWRARYAPGPVLSSATSLKRGETKPERERERERAPHMCVCISMCVYIYIYISVYVSACVSLFIFLLDSCVQLLMYLSTDRIIYTFIQKLFLHTAMERRGIRSNKNESSLLSLQRASAPARHSCHRFAFQNVTERER